MDSKFFLLSVFNEINRCSNARNVPFSLAVLGNWNGVNCV